MTNALSQIALGLGAGYLMATVSESFTHRMIGHAPRRRRRWWEARRRLLGVLKRSHFRHAVVHHGLTFRSNHVTQFDDADHKDAVHRRAMKEGDGGIEASGYGLRPDWTGFLSFNATTIPLVAALGWWAGPWSALAAAPWLAVAPALSRWVHPYLHRSHASAVSEAPRGMAWLLRTRYFRAVARHHYLHHKHPGANFNLLLGGDWILGVHRSATEADLREMREIGLRVD